MRDSFVVLIRHLLQAQERYASCLDDIVIPKMTTRNKMNKTKTGK